MFRRHTFRRNANMGVDNGFGDAVGFMRRIVGVAVVVGLLLAGCADDESGASSAPPVPRTVAELDPCALLTDQEQADLHLTVQDSAEEDHRRSCSFIATDLSDDPREDWIDTLDLTIRDSAAPNLATDAKRVAETYQRERKAKLTTKSVGGRTVYQVGPVRPIGCRLLLDVNATSSVEAAPMMNEQAPGCMHPDLARLLSAKLPVPDPAPARADHDRPVDIFAIDPCNLISQDRRTGLSLDGGTFSAEVMPSCTYHTNAAATGELTLVSVTIWTSGASGPDSEQRVARTVNERTAYEKRDTTGSSSQATSMCDYYLEVTAATSVQVGSWLLGPQSIDLACQSAEDLAADIEPRLPLAVT
jgi:hypothetical protein